MKASVKFRPEEAKPPLFRAKVPVSVLGLSLVSCAAIGGKEVFSFHLRSALPSGPSFKVSYLPNLSPHSFSLTLTSGVGPLGSPRGSPLLFSAHLSLSPFSQPSILSFSVRLAPQFGDFSLRKTAVSSSTQNSIPKENGGGIHRPIPVSRGGEGAAAALDEFLSQGQVSAWATLPVHRRAALRFRWAVNFPPPLWGGLPYLTVSKIGIKLLEMEDRKEARGRSEERGKQRDLEAMKETSLCLRKEMEELHREHQLIKESIDLLENQVFERRGDIGCFSGIFRRERR